eukprot:jgi/Bigna1/142365/aug1.69_g17073
MLNPTRASSTPHDELSRSQKHGRRKSVEEKMENAKTRISENHFMVEGHGTVKPTQNASRDAVIVSVKPGSKENEMLLDKFTLLNTHQLSKKKLQEMRMVAGDSTPAQQNLNKAMAECKDIAQGTLDLDIGDKHFHVGPNKWLKCLLEKRGLSRESEVHLMMEAFKVAPSLSESSTNQFSLCALHLVQNQGDGRRTGRSMHSVTFQFGILNEGRQVFREDRQCILSVLLGKEGKACMDQLQTQLDRLEKLQKDGLTFKKGDESWKVKVALHLTGDAKWQQLGSGMISFRSSVKTD